MQARNARIADELAKAEHRREILYAVLLKTAARLVVSDKRLKALRRRAESTTELLRRSAEAARRAASSRARRERNGSKSADALADGASANS